MSDSLRALLAAGRDRLRSAGVEDARLEAEHLLAFAAGRPRLALRTAGGETADADVARVFGALVERRSRREPLQYILGTAAFRELLLKVDRRVLVPRPETEQLVEAVLRWAGERRGDAPPRSALDVGTGSGAIALSLLVEGPFTSVVATDASAGALDVALENARTAGVNERLELRAGPYWEPVKGGERFDVIVSNPPYVAETDAKLLPSEVGDWEPGAALFAGPDGLTALRAIVTGAAAHLLRGGLLALEVGEGQAGRVRRLIEETGEFEAAAIRRDLSGRERIVLAETH